MAGLLAWAADVVGGSGTGNEDDDDEIGLPLLVFTPEQQQRALELDRAAAALHRSIKDLRLRIPPEHISQRLPHLHAHTMASSAALALQLNAHTTTREQAQLREVSLQDENAAYEKAISNCQKKIQEKQDEANELHSRLKELDLIEKDLKENLEKVEAEVKFSQSMVSKGGGNNAGQVDLVDESSRAVKSEELEEKKAQLNSFDVMVQTLEEEWSLVQKESMKQPSPGRLVDFERNIRKSSEASTMYYIRPFVRHRNPLKLSGLEILSREIMRTSLTRDGFTECAGGTWDADVHMRQRLRGGMSRGCLPMYGR
ncbi:hypothetical protein KFK09_022954 [Dendrobium nobile]|uniref:Uncharacterized protein n=1 Tax=Dendrobium nobile TaxID=94219 RepID=A0A8T3AK74_DENNO|nr:hypothetical protein KFK09_022954 [Dendrobium nobile]